MTNGGKVLEDARVVVTGGFGFLGSNLIHHLVADNEVVSIDCLSPDAGGNRGNLDGLQASCTTIERDLADPRTYEDPEVRRALAEATHIFHCAARTSHPRSMDDPLGSLDANGQATLRLMEHLRRTESDARIVHPGTTSQTGAKIHDRIDEDHPENPRDIYSVHKSLQEKYMLVYAHAHGLDATSLRISNVYGPRAAIHSPALGFANYFIGLGLQDAALTVYDSGTQVRSFLHVDDVLQALIAAAVTPAAKGEVFQIANPVKTSVRDFAETVVQEIGGRLETIPYPKHRASTEIGDAVFSIDKALEHLDWAPKTDLSAGVRTTATYYRPRLDHYLVTA